MSLRVNLTPPLVVEPTRRHTHTVIFLHRFPEGTSDDDLIRDSKVLAIKRTKNHKTLHEQFPSIRWVFPHPKAHTGTSGQHWSNLSAEDLASALGPDAGAAAWQAPPGLPYITQVVLQEAERLGSLAAADRVVLGGQGDTAEAAHDAMARIPGDVPSQQQQQLDEKPPRCHVARLAGFVGMHAADGAVTRDVRAYGISRKTDGGGSGGGNSIVANTPHDFIKGGYKVQTTTWDGRRIDDFADFLESVHVRRVVLDDDDDGQKSSSKELLTPRERPEKMSRNDAKDELDDKQKHALEITRQKAADEEHRSRILVRIEADKVERKIKKERERQARLHRVQAQAQKQQSPNTTQTHLRDGRGVFLLGDTPRPFVQDGAVGGIDTLGTDPWRQEGRDGESEEVEREEGQVSTAFRHGPRRRGARQGRRAGEGEGWGPRSQVRGEMTEGQMTALGLLEDGGEVVKAEQTG